MNIELLKECVRPYNKELDENLFQCSHSKLEVFENCNFRYNLQYNQKKRSNDTSLALEIGSLMHKILELKGLMLTNGEEVDYTKLNEYLINGYEEQDEKTKEVLLGVKALKKKYFEQWYEKDNASGMNYDEKLKKFDDVLHKEMEDDDWKPTYFELPFSFVWREKYIITGFIDRIDTKDGEYRVCDYKTSKAVFDTKKLATAQQMGVYACAILSMFNTLPTEFLYRFILIDESQKAMTLNWEKRLVSKLDKIFDKIAACETGGIWKPAPSPLCFWCSFNKNNPNATEYKYECEYYSLWTPTEKTFATNKEFNAATQTVEQVKNNRKLIF